MSHQENIGINQKVEDEKSRDQKDGTWTANGHATVIGRFKGGDDYMLRCIVGDGKCKSGAATSCIQTCVRSHCWRGYWNMLTVVK